MTRRSSFYLVLILCVGLLYHVIMSALIHYSTVDSATEGLMALNILEGERPLFFYGQNYLSSIEAYVAALFFWILGASEMSLSLAPIVFYLGWLVATYCLFTELIDRRVGFCGCVSDCAKNRYLLVLSGYT